MKPVLLITMFLLAVATVSGQTPSGIAGDYVEARSNHVYTCGCLFSGELETDGREAILVWDFRSGSFEGTPLTGVRVAATLVGNRNLSVDGAVRKSILYVDQGASGAQQEAMFTLLSERYTSLLGEIMAVRQVPILFEKDADKVNVKIGEIGGLTVRRARLPEDAHLGSRLWYGPFISLRDPVLGTTEHYEYWGGDFERQWRTEEPSITAYFGTFDLARR